MTPHARSRRDPCETDDPAPCSLPSRNGSTAICSRWSICQRGAACIAFREWAVTGKTGHNTKL